MGQQTAYAAYVTSVDGYGDKDIQVFAWDSDDGSTVGPALVTLPYVDGMDGIDIAAALRRSGWRVTSEQVDATDFGSVADVEPIDEA